jgi:hypothetical protein
MKIKITAVLGKKKKNIEFKPKSKTEFGVIFDVVKSDVVKKKYLPDIDFDDVKYIYRIDKEKVSACELLKLCEKSIKKLEESSDKKSKDLKKKDKKSKKDSKSKKSDDVWGKRKKKGKKNGKKKKPNIVKDKKVHITSRQV